MVDHWVPSDQPHCSLALILQVLQSPYRFFSFNRYFLTCWEYNNFVLIWHFFLSQQPHTAHFDLKWAGSVKLPFLWAWRSLATTLIPEMYKNKKKKCNFHSTSLIYFKIVWKAIGKDFISSQSCETYENMVKSPNFMHFTFSKAVQWTRMKSVLGWI